PAYGPQNDVTLKMPAFEWVHVQLHQQKGMISLSPPTICNSAQGTTRLVIDIHNTADQAFGEIESVNLYVGDGWSFSQNGQEASKTDSDDPRFKVRHAFVPQMRRINPKGLTQLTAVGTKILAWATGETPLKDSYKMSGRIMVRIVTATRS
ncbi:hypothetical protein ACDY99_30950, partial [Achromobacter dolens]|uniref:hypothetical protein n=1 Tax=Achromobacter dolens TaxID=1287738 RepID=UPI003558CF35